MDLSFFPLFLIPFILHAKSCTFPEPNALRSADKMPITASLVLVLPYIRVFTAPKNDTPDAIFIKILYRLFIGSPLKLHRPSCLFRGPIAQCTGPKQKAGQSAALLFYFISLALSFSYRQLPPPHQELHRAPERSNALHYRSPLRRALALPQERTLAQEPIPPHMPEKPQTVGSSTLLFFA